MRIPKRKKQRPSNRIVHEGESVLLSGAISDAELEKSLNGKRFNSICFQNFRYLDVSAAREIAKTSTASVLAVHSGISRAALTVLMQIPGLKEVYIYDLKEPGRLRNLENATTLTTFRGHSDLRTSDIVEISRVPNLQFLGAQCCEIGLRAIEAISKSPHLRTVDLECVPFTDQMAKTLAQSRSIEDVILPATGLSKEGLHSISKMHQMKYLDIWANGLPADSLAPLEGHLNLQKLELGGFPSDPEKRIKARELIPYLKSMPALKTVWFEGVVVTDEEVEYLKNKYDFRLLNDW